MKTIGFMLASIIVAGLIGLVLGFVVIPIYDQGYFDAWRKLPPAPGPVSQLLTVSANNPVIRTSDGSIYMYADWDNPPDWFQMPAPIGDSDPSIITKPCNRSSPEFSILVDPPTNVADCFQVQINMIGRFAFVLDNAGAVWKWGHHPGFLDTQFEIITFPFAGSMVGGAIGLAIAFFIGATRRKDAQAMDGLVL